MVMTNRRSRKPRHVDSHRRAPTGMALVLLCLELIVASLILVAVLWFGGRIHMGIGYLLVGTAFVLVFRPVHRTSRYISFTEKTTFYLGGLYELLLSSLILSRMDGESAAQIWSWGDIGVMLVCLAIEFMVLWTGAKDVTRGRDMSWFTRTLPFHGAGIVLSSWLLSGYLLHENVMRDIVGTGIVMICTFELGKQFWHERLCPRTSEVVDNGG